MFQFYTKFIGRLEYFIYTSWFNFLLHYRKTVFGPAWLLVGPILFIGALGGLFAEIGSADPAVFIPHLTVGLIVWTLITGFVNGSTTVYQRSRPQILQGGRPLIDIVIIDVCSTILQFAHQVIIIVAIFILYSVSVTPYALLCLAGVGLLIANGAWLTVVFGIVGARFRDLTEVVRAAMRIAFLATPIIWFPGEGARGGAMNAVLTFNPFYHFLEVVRAPLLGSPVAPLSWGVVLVTTVAGFALAYMMHRRFSRQVPLWV